MVWALTAALGLSAALAGCSGHARVELNSLDYRSIDPPAARAFSLNFDCCYWWTDEDDQVWVVMEYQRRSLLGRYGRFVLKMSLVLDQLPSGRERLYQLDQRSFRAVARGGPIESRFTAATGVVTLSRQLEERLRGSFRLLARKQTSRWFGGWRRPTDYLMQGTFSAVYDQKRGYPIAAETESQGWDRGPVRSNTPVPARVSD